MKTQPSQQKKFVQDVFYLTLGTNYTNFMAALRGLIIRGFIGPTLAGLLSLLNTIYFFMSFVYRPFQGGVAREIPYYKGKRDFETVTRLQQGSFSIIFFLSLILNLGLFIASFFIQEHETGILRWSLRIWAPISFAKSICAYLVVFFRTEKRFFRVFKYHVFNATLITVFGIIFTYFYSFQGLLLTTLVVQLTSTVYFLKIGEFPFKPAIRREMKRVVRQFVVRGSPMVMNAIIFMCFRQIDRVVVISMLGLKQMGFYSIGIMMSNMLFMIPSSIWQVVAPGFLERGAQCKSDATPLKPEVFHNTRTVAGIIPPIFSMAAFALPFLILYALPNFTPGIVPSQIIIFGTFFIGIYSMFAKLYIITDRMRYIILISFIILLAAVVMNIWALALQAGITGIAIATFVAFFLYAVTVIFHGGVSLLRCSLWEIVKICGWILIPFTYTMAAFLVANQYLAPHRDAFLNDALRFAAGIAIIAASFIPFWIYTNKKTRLLTTFLYDMWEKVVKLYRLLLRR